MSRAVRATSCKTHPCTHAFSAALALALIVPWRTVDSGGCFPDRTSHLRKKDEKRSSRDRHLFAHVKILQSTSNASEVDAVTSCCFCWVSRDCAHMDTMMALESKVEDTEFQAVVFVTGSSSLLHPLTSDPATLPKALLPVAGVPLLAYQLLLLSKAGFSGTETPSTHCVHWCALVCTGVHWCALVCAGVRWSALVGTACIPCSCLMYRIACLCLRCYVLQTHSSLYPRAVWLASAIFWQHERACCEPQCFGVVVVCLGWGVGCASFHRDVHGRMAMVGAVSGLLSS